MGYIRLHIPCNKDWQHICCSRSRRKKWSEDTTAWPCNFIWIIAWQSWWYKSSYFQGGNHAMLQFWALCRFFFLVKERDDTQHFHGEKSWFYSETTRFLGPKFQVFGLAGADDAIQQRSRDAVRVFHRKSLDIFRATAVLLWKMRTTMRMRMRMMMMRMMMVMFSWKKLVVLTCSPFMFNFGRYKWRCNSSKTNLWLAAVVSSTGMTYELAIADKAGVFIYVFTVYLDMLLMLMLLHSRFDEREHHATTFFLGISGSTLQLMHQDKTPEKLSLIWVILCTILTHFTLNCLKKGG